MKNESDSILQTRKFFQRNKILGMIRFHDNVSRNDIKKATSYSMTTVLNVVSELITSGFIYEEDCEEARVGRRPVWLRINPSGGYFIGIEFNGSHMYCDMLDFAGSIIYRSETDMYREDDQTSIIAKIIKNISMARDFLKEDKDKVLGIGVGVPGYVKKSLGISCGYRLFQNWENVPVKEIIEKEFRIPCYVDNNVNVMAFAYKWLYFNRDCEDFVFLSIRTGARMIPVIDNRLVLSHTGFSGEIGHIKIAAGHEMCSCGKFGCLNTKVSDYAIAARIREGILIGRFTEIKDMVNGQLNNVTVETFVESVRLGHQDSISLMKEIAQYLGEALGIVMNILAPRKIIIFGMLMQIGESFLDEVKNNICNTVVLQNIDAFELEAANQNPDLGAIGAAAMSIQEQFEFIDRTI